MSVRLRILRERDFRLYFCSHLAGLLGRSMTPVALTFAVLNQGGTAGDVGLVLMAQSIPLVLFVLMGGVVADRLPRKVVMLTADVMRCISQAILAVLLLTGAPPLPVIMALAGVLGLGTSVFVPAMNGLIPEITRAARLQDANALLSMGSSLGKTVGPALGGVIVAVLSPGWVIVIDAGTYGISAAFLALLPLGRVREYRASFLAELREGWREFRSRTWLWVIVVQFAFWHMLVLAPFMVLGAVVAENALGGPSAWGAILAAWGAGAVGGGFAMLYIRPSRPMLWAVVGTFGLGLPLILLAVRAPTAAVAMAALAAGLGNGVFDTLWDTTLQREIPPEARARVSSYDVFGSVAFLPVGYAIVGPLSMVLGVGATLWLAAIWLLVSSSVVVAVPGVHGLRSSANVPG